MPIAKFEMPDGRVARFEVPDGTTPEQAQGMISEYVRMQAHTKPMPVAKSAGAGRENYWSNFRQGMITELQSLPLGLGKGMSDIAQDKPAESYDKGPMGLAQFVLERTAKLSPASAPAYIMGKHINNVPYVDRNGVQVADMSKPLTNAARQNAQDSVRLAQKPGGLAGQVAGGVITAPLLPQTQTLKQAGALGATLGLMRPVDAEDGQQTSGRLKNAVAGGAGGFIGGALANGLSRGIGLIARKGRELYNAGRVTAEQVSDQVMKDVQVLMRDNGVDFDRLSQAAKEETARIIKDALGTGSKQNANAAAREAALANLKVPIKGTKGQLTQDYAQHRRETILADSGVQEVRDVMDSQAAAVAKNLDLARQAAKGQPMAPVDAGRKVRDTFERLYQAEKDKTKALYQAADVQEGKLPVKLGADMLKFFKENAGFEGVAGMMSKAKALGLLATDKEGNLVAKAAPARNLYELRRTLSTVQKGGGTAGTFAGQAKQLVDDAFDSVGPMYKQAASQRRQQAVKFELPQILQKIYGEAKGGVDPKIADENLVRTLAKGSIQDIQNLKKTLLLNPKSVNPKEAAGLWQDIRQQVISDIQDGSVVENGALTKINYATFKKKLDSIGDERLRLILGPKTANELRKIENAARILFKAPESKTNGSATEANRQLMERGLMQTLERIVGKTAIGRVAVGATRAASEATKRQIATTEALTPISKQISKDLRKRQLEQLLSGLPASAARRMLGQLGALTGIGFVSQDQEAE